MVVHRYLLCFCMLYSVCLQAQAPIFKFLSDSVRVGEPTKAVFYFYHRYNQEIVFPDSNYNYQPFEFVSKVYFPTATKDSVSLDSAVYTLTTFEVEGVPSLTLPVFIYSNKDTIKVFAEADSIVIHPLIAAVTDSLKLQSNTQSLPLDKQFNYWILIIGASVLLVLIIVVYAVFGGNILEQIKRYRRRLAHQLFLATFDKLIADTALSQPKHMEEAVSLWKKYIEKLEDKPYTTFTSSEIAYHLHRPELKKNLQGIDVAIYSGRTGTVASQDFTSLRETAIQLYTKSQTGKNV